MNIEQWTRYSEVWSLPETQRRARLAEVATPDIVYTDPNTVAKDAEAFLAYIAGFQENLPGGGFQITAAFGHHGQSLAHWNMVAGDGSVIGTGSSFALHGSDGRFSSLTGFFNAT